MGIIFIVLLAIGLAMDCFAISIACGASKQPFKAHQGVVMALTFGLFQGIMPLIGWLCGFYFTERIIPIAHWIAFIILFIIGIKMIVDGLKTTTDNSHNTFFSLKTTIILAISTSIDALAIGLIFIGSEDKLKIGILIIGIVSFLFSIIGLYIGKYLKRYLKIKVEILGGLILIVIGTKILIEHLFFT